MLKRISQERLTEFESRGVTGITRWLRVATDKYFIEGCDSWAFDPFGFAIGTIGSQSLANDIKLIYVQLSPQGKDDFNEALISVLRTLPADPGKLAIWMFLIELAWLLPVPAAVSAMEERFNEHFFDSIFADTLTENAQDSFNAIFLFTINTIIMGPEAERYIKRLVESPRFESAYSRIALTRLCAIAPEHWTGHFALTRDMLHALFRSSDNEIQVQNELAEDILSEIGFERLTNGLSRLVFSDVDLPQDTWFFDALVRTKKVIPTKRGDRLVIAPAGRPHFWHEVPENVPVAWAHYAPQRHGGRAVDTADELLGPPLLYESA